MLVAETKQETGAMAMAMELRTTLECVARVDEVDMEGLPCGGDIRPFTRYAVDDRGQRVVDEERMAIDDLSASFASLSLVSSVHTPSVGPSSTIIPRRHSDVDQLIMALSLLTLKDDTGSSTIPLNS